MGTIGKPPADLGGAYDGEFPYYGQIKLGGETSPPKALSQ